MRTSAKKKKKKLLLSAISSFFFFFQTRYASISIPDHCSIPRPIKACNTSPGADLVESHVHSLPLIPFLVLSSCLAPLSKVRSSHPWRVHGEITLRIPPNRPTNQPQAVGYLPQIEMRWTVRNQLDGVDPDPYHIPFSYPLNDGSALRTTLRGQPKTKSISSC